MRSQGVILVLALATAIWIVSEFVRVGSSNMPTIADRLMMGMVAAGPLLLVATAAAIAVWRKGRAPLPVAATLLLTVGWVAGTLWAFAVGLASG